MAFLLDDYIKVQPQAQVQIERFIELVLEVELALELYKDSR
jgi:2-keto-4-pentenoate hydratase